MSRANRNDLRRRRSLICVPQLRHESGDNTGRCAQSALKPAGEPHAIHRIHTAPSQKRPIAQLHLGRPDRLTQVLTELMKHTPSPRPLGLSVPDHQPGPGGWSTRCTGQVPDRVTTDGHGSYPRAIRSTFGWPVVHRTSAYRNNGLEQDHRGVKGRIRCMRGFKSFAAAERFCRSYDELRNFRHVRTRHNQHILATRRRLLHLRRATIVLAILEAS
jgi:hypothetical protein